MRIWLHRDFAHSRRGHRADVSTPQILDVAGSDAADEAEMRKRVMEQMRRNFKPEFLNRLDEFIIFHPLGRREIRR